MMLVAVEALQCFLELPRAESETLLLFPTANGTPALVHHALYKFNRAHLPTDCANVSNTLWRKYHHSELMNLTSDDAKLQRLLTIIDAHSSQTQWKHYILRDPAHDANLAKEMLKVTFGDHVPWPSSEELRACMQGAAFVLPTETASGVHVFRVTSSAMREEPAEPEPDPDDADFVVFTHWKFAHMFRVSEEYLHLPLGGGEGDATALPLVDAAMAEDDETDEAASGGRRRKRRADDMVGEAAGPAGSNWYRAILTAPILRAILCLCVCTMCVCAFCAFE